MTEGDHRVALIVDRVFGDSLETLETSVHVWVVDTPVNRVVAERIWKSRNGADHVAREVTTFHTDLTRTPEANAVDILPVIGAHLGANGDDPCHVIELFGASLNTALRGALDACGFTNFATTSTGFVASKPGS
jgi:hypothetical protein